MNPSPYSHWECRRTSPVTSINDNLLHKVSVDACHIGCIHLHSRCDIGAHPITAWQKGNAISPPLATTPRPAAKRTEHYTFFSSQMLLQVSLLYIEKHNSQQRHMDTINTNLGRQRLNQVGSRGLMKMLTKSTKTEALPAAAATPTIQYALIKETSLGVISRMLYAFAPRPMTLLLQ